MMAFEGPVEDRLAIRELIDAYADAVILHDAVAWGATWAEDGVWSLPDYPEMGEAHGREAIVTTWKAAMENYPGIVFVANPGSIVVDGDRAIVRSYTSEVYDMGGATKRDGKWLFQKRVFKTIHRE